MTDLAGTQLSNLLETLPGIAKVLRSPVADAIVALIKAASGQGPFSAADVDELMKFAVRRNLISAEEGERVMQEARQAMAGIAPPTPKPKPAAVAAPVVRTPHPVRHVKPAPRKPAKAPVKTKAAAKKAKPARRPAHKK